MCSDDIMHYGPGWPAQHLKATSMGMGRDRGLSWSCMRAADRVRVRAVSSPTIIGSQTKWQRPSWAESYPEAAPQELSSTASSWPSKGRLKEASRPFASWQCRRRDLGSVRAESRLSWGPGGWDSKKVKKCQRGGDGGEGMRLRAWGGHDWMNAVYAHTCADGPR